MPYRVKLLDHDSNVFYSEPFRTCEAASYLADLYAISGRALPCDIQTVNPATGKWFNLGCYCGDMR